MAGTFTSALAHILMFVRILYCFYWLQLPSCRQRSTTLANCTTRILSSSLVIAQMVTTDSWCMSSCLKEVWKIIYSDVCFLFHCNLFLLKFYHFNILNFRQVQQKLSIPLGGADPLPWGIRLKVAIGAARGLSFLHDAENQVIYRDFKASNILLDSVYVKWLLTLVLTKLLFPLFFT